MQTAARLARGAFTLLALGLLLGSPGAGAWCTNNLTLIHTGDIRGRLLPVNKFGAECHFRHAHHGDVSDMEMWVRPHEECMGGVAARKYFVDTMRRLRGAENVLTVDSGNMYWGSQFYNYVSARAARKTRPRGACAHPRGASVQGGQVTVA